jgi:hypothetical protein
MQLEHTLKQMLSKLEKREHSLIAAENEMNLRRSKMESVTQNSNKQQVKSDSSFMSSFCVTFEVELIVVLMIWSHQK